MHILLVEDNRADGELIRLGFEGHGFGGTLDWVRDGEEALDYISKQNGHTSAQTPDLILLDLNLPKRHGKEVLRFIKESEEHCVVPVIIMSSSQDPHDVNACYQLHANGYMRKPLDFASLKALIDSLLEFWSHHIVLPMTPHPSA